MSDDAPRAGIIVTGTEVLTGRVRDRNGPWLSDRLLELGVDLAHTMIVGDRPADMHAALEFMAQQGLQVIITSGGLGPTADYLRQKCSRASRTGRCSSTGTEERIAEIVDRCSCVFGTSTRQTRSTRAKAVLSTSRYQPC
jgi:nicotinamide-nucleotide amidase